MVGADGVADAAGRGLVHSAMNERHGMPKVLCIEDEDDIRQIMVEELSDAGYEVVEAADGQGGLNAILNQKPDLVISDIGMPVMDGHDLLEVLRSDHPDLADMPFIFLTALADRNCIVKSKKLGADDYLTKPVDFEVLFATIESRLNQVERMNSRKERQFVKIYRSVNEPAAHGEPDSAPVASDRKGSPKQAESSAGGTEPPKATGDAPVQARIEAMAKQSGGSVLAGQMQFVGLDEIKAALGSRWESRFQQVRDIAENTIRKHLSSGDLCEMSEGDKFLICFASLDEKAAALKAQSIAREIRHKILGDENIDPQIKERCEVASDIHEITVSPDEAGESDDIVDLIVSRIGAAAQAARRREAKTIARMIESCRVLQMPVMKSQGGRAPLAIARFDDETRADIAALRNARPGSDGLESEIDILKLGRTSELLCEQAHLSQPVLLVDVALSTLENRRLMARYQKILGSLTEAATNRLIFNVRGLPKEFVSSRTLPLLNPLRQYCRQVALELGELSLGNIDPGTLRTPILTSPYHALMARIDRNATAVKRVIGELHRGKARLLIYDAPSHQDARRLLKQGVDLVACLA